MKKLWLHSVCAYLKLGMFFYFKKIRIHNIENIPTDKPVLLLGNHQNALLDALLIAVYGNQFSYFLTRAAVFKKTLVSKLLKSLQMLPVYRIRDGWNNLNNNNAIFATCTELLNQGESIVIFPEGNHNLERRIRPLSKGFTRIVFDTLQKYPSLDLQLVPVGLNYKDALSFPDSASMFFGKPIAAKAFITENKTKAVSNLKNKIQWELMQLTTHIPEDDYKSSLKRLQELQVDFLKPQEVNACLKSGFKKVKAERKSNTRIINKLFKLLLKINLILPFAIWKLAIEPIIEELEFKSTFRFTVALTLVPAWIMFITFILLIYFGWFIALSYFALSLLIGLLAIKL
ncbi:lysophospholipid acyltransferase family protein [Seonamhaeicola aphaedonensis]|uniref:1-acyl-sn-glycerol-3-phosphate acyltransferase n=1 Tax=Seonamhaeicola aphaedonensis TaxID=1461338 RepID=A0A3D9HFT5_9FLAO|nr:lysophospholipid acyltransferase family protein [Seonamhaeicola aphaedonensis]RED48330.1 1-acyl-sn-glycerol-3-phosphate acyltransferase [Seonamhaeicola aphaedonensis]